jgi:hypothetical protein
VNQNRIAFAASTADPLLGSKKYWLEVDSSALFNSKGKYRTSIVSNGGLIQFPGVKLPFNNFVYYWRVAPDGSNHWNSFSFIYKQDSMPGFEQAHFYQHTESDLDGLVLDTGSRAFQFAPDFRECVRQSRPFILTPTRTMILALQLMVHLSVGALAWAAQ